MHPGARVPAKVTLISAPDATTRGVLAAGGPIPVVSSAVAALFGAFRVSPRGNAFFVAGQKDSDTPDAIRLLDQSRRHLEDSTRRGQVEQGARGDRRHARAVLWQSVQRVPHGIHPVPVLVPQP